MMGWNRGERQLDSSDEDFIYNRIHPENLPDKRLLEFEFFKMIDRLPPERKLHLKATSHIRVKDHEDRYVWVDNTTQVLCLSPAGSMWLILCICDLSDDQSPHQGINPRIKDYLTGEITSLSLTERKAHILTHREKEILRLIRQGKSSKLIAASLCISKNTVDRHRQNILQKARQGYFLDLGVDVVWMTDVYEQIHGWMSGSGSVNDFPHYGYHGYYPLDYTQIDKNYCTAEEFRQVVDELHSQGIRVMLGANINDPGYPTLPDAVQYGFADTGLTPEQSVEHRRDWSYDDFYADRLNWKGWYGHDWIRMPDENWDESDPLQATLFGLPDYRTRTVLPPSYPNS